MSLYQFLLLRLLGSHAEMNKQTRKTLSKPIGKSSFHLFSIGLLICSFMTLQNASAHDPSLHGFKLTTFDPPFPAPAFELPQYKAESLSLADLQGSYVLLNFWATWCPPCLVEMPTMEAAFQKLKGEQFRVVAISSDEGGEAEIAPFLDKLDISFDVLMDTDKSVSSLYGAINLPLTFILNPQGEVIAGSEGERDWASEEALSVLEEMIAGQSAQ